MTVLFFPVKTLEFSSRRKKSRTCFSNLFDKLALFLYHLYGVTLKALMAWVLNLYFLSILEQSMFLKARFCFEPPVLISLHNEKWNSKVLRTVFFFEDGVLSLKSFRVFVLGDLFAFLSLYSLFW